MSSTGLPSTRCAVSSQQYVLWCPTCRRAMLVGIETMQAFGETGWPECCRRVMLCGPAAGLTLESNRLPVSEAHSPLEAAYGFFLTRTHPIG